MEKAARQIAAELKNAGHLAYFAGGCVRDQLRGLKPKDFDIATDATPEAVQKLFRRTYAVGEHFGVIKVLEGGFEFDVATFRSDEAYVDGRRPQSVRFTSPQEDAQRRDFTINGLFFDPVENKMIDYVDGVTDFNNHILRAIGDPVQRFAEDRLRMLRAIRFACTLDFAIEPATWSALCAAASEITEISAERIREELVRIFTSAQRLKGFDLLDQSGLLRILLPELEACKGCEQPKEFHPEGDVFVHTRLLLSHLSTDTPVSTVLAFSVLLHDIGKPPCFAVDPTGRIRFNGHEYVGAEMAKKVMERLRFSRAETDAVVEAVRHHMAFKDVQQMRVSTLKRFLSRDGFDDELELHRVDCSSSHGMLDNYHFLIAKREEFAHEPLIPKPLVTGNDLIALGFKPGPQFKEILEGVQTRQLEGTIHDSAEALEWIKKEFKPQSG